jgi:hypothetical protein
VQWRRKTRENESATLDETHFNWIIVANWFFAESSGKLMMQQPQFRRCFRWRTLWKSWIIQGKLLVSLHPPSLPYLGRIMLLWGNWKRK